MYALAPHRKQRGHPDWGALEGQLLSMLRQVVTERGPEAVVRTLSPAARVCGATRAGPDIALEVAVLRALAEAARRTTVEVVPVAGAQLLDVLGVAAAVGRSR